MRHQTARCKGIVLLRATAPIATVNPQEDGAAFTRQVKIERFAALRIVDDIALCSAALPDLLALGNVAGVFGRVGGDAFARIVFTLQRRLVHAPEKRCCGIHAHTPR
ncbi:hypothetical protein [Nitratireductor aquibiodomus]|uniref:hypothetical protein n=1 Tax=Nitratireductor aquibiodomus TaxID=204799 RepID=UPI001FCC1419|nr:hypothetical protein [Nitratireductor aquibiodomus]